MLSAGSIRSSDGGEGYDELPSCYRPFVDMRETDWRGHRLFGIEPEFGNNWEDRRGQDCVISIRGRCAAPNTIGARVRATHLVPVGPHRERPV